MGNMSPMTDRYIPNQMKHCAKCERPHTALRRTQCERSRNPAFCSRGLVLRAEPRACPPEVAAVAAFLASEDASYVTAQIISVSGGMA